MEKFIGGAKCLVILLSIEPLNHRLSLSTNIGNLNFT